MASGDTIETIEVVEPSLTINMNNAKDPGGVHESLDESEGNCAQFHHRFLGKLTFLGHARHVKFLGHDSLFSTKPNCCLNNNKS
jgi:hypothetical protein